MDAPRRIFERHVGREALLQQALDRLVPEIDTMLLSADCYRRW